MVIFSKCGLFPRPANAMAERRIVTDYPAAAKPPFANPAPLVAPDVEAIGMRELSRITIGGAIKDDRARAFWQRDAGRRFAKKQRRRSWRGIR
jgi:hypothetical protein